MSGLSRVLPFAALAAAASLVLPSSSGAGVIACQSVNGHVACAGPGPVTCRTGYGWTTCSDEPAAASPVESGSSRQRLRIERRNPAGDRVLSVERNGHTLHLRNGRLDLHVQ